jgi:hypothetical protein
MRHILLAGFSLMLLTGISCNTVHSGNKMIAFKPDRQSIRYKGNKPPTRVITAIVKDDLNNVPLDQQSIELYIDIHLLQPLMSTMTTRRGKFSFTVTDGIYFIVINRYRYNEKQLTVLVEGTDIDLNEIRLPQVFE